MDVLLSILLFLHIVAFVVGGASSVVMPVLGSKMATATPETLKVIYSVGRYLSSSGTGAMVVLLVTGPLMVWLKYDGFASLSPWFWLKMALVAVMLVGIIFAGIGMRKVQTGDPTAEANTRLAGMITSVVFVGVLLSAVLAFN